GRPAGPPPHRTEPVPRFATAAGLPTGVRRTAIGRPAGAPRPGDGARPVVAADSGAAWFGPGRVSALIAGSAIGPAGQPGPSWRDSTGAATLAAQRRSVSPAASSRVRRSVARREIVPSAATALHATTPRLAVVPLRRRAAAPAAQP